MRFARGILLLLLMCIDGCVDPLPFHLNDATPGLVVDGMITDKPGPYTVRLFMSVPPSDQDEALDMVTGASVWIVDDAEKSFVLNETAPGIYLSDPTELKGEIGRTYHLKIMLADGTEYRSLEETIRPAGVLERVYFEYEEGVINQTSPELPQDAISFYVDAQSDPSNESGFQRWRSSAIYEVLTNPELREEVSNGKRVPAPLACSGYINDMDVLKQVDTCSCCNCWVTERPLNAVVSSGRYAENNQHNRVAIARVPLESWRFFRKYYVEVEQLSISESVFEFWKRVSAQQKGTGSLFQPNAVSVDGNIYAVDDPDKKVFGIFSAASATTGSVFVTRGQIPVPVATPDTITFDCRFSFPNATNIRPSFW